MSDLKSGMPTNGGYMTDLLRQHYALQQPKLHIPLGIGVFVALSAISAVPLLPFVGAALVGYDARRRLKKTRKIVEKSNTDPDILLKGLSQQQQEVISSFAKAYPLDKPRGAPAEKKHQPRIQASNKQQIETETKNQTTEREAVKTQDAGNQGTSSMPKSLDDEPIDEGWKPEDLPQPFIPYLASQIHILMSATTGSGKTHTLKSLCTELSNKGHNLLICDPKGTQWGELKPAAVIMKTGLDYLMVLRDLERELNKRIDLLSDGKPVGEHLWAVFDEWTLLKGKCQTLEPDGRASIEQRLLSLIAAGRELNMHLVMVNQSHLLGDLSLSGSKNTFSSGLRDNLCTLGLGCKTTQDNAGNPMRGNSKSIDSMLNDRALLRDKTDRDAAQVYHAGLRRESKTNRTFALYASQLFIGPTPELATPELLRLQPFYSSDGSVNNE